LFQCSSGKKIPISVMDDFLARRRKRRNADDEDDSFEESSDEEEEGDDNEQHGPGRVQRVLWERCDPLTHYNNVDFHRNFRFTKENLRKVVALIKDKIEFKSKRGCPLNPEQQTCLTLTFFASGSFQHVSGYMAGVKKTTAWATIRRVSRALVALSDQLIAMPTIAEMRASSEKHWEKYGIPNAPLGVDGTHIRLGKLPSQIELPAGLVPQDFWCRKQFPSVNVQVKHLSINHVRKSERNYFS
jgi:hypothetical protein